MSNVTLCFKRMDIELVDVYVSVDCDTRLITTRTDYLGEDGSPVRQETVVREVTDYKIEITIPWVCADNIVESGESVDIVYRGKTYPKVRFRSPERLSDGTTILRGGCTVKKDV